MVNLNNGICESTVLKFHVQSNRLAISDLADFHPQTQGRVGAIDSFTVHSAIFRTLYILLDIGIRPAEGEKGVFRGLSRIENSPWVWERCAGNAFCLESRWPPSNQNSSTRRPGPSEISQLGLVDADRIGRMADDRSFKQRQT